MTEGCPDKRRRRVASLQALSQATRQQNRHRSIGTTVGPQGDTQHRATPVSSRNRVGLSIQKVDLTRDAEELPHYRH